MHKYTRAVIQRSLRIFSDCKTNGTKSELLSLAEDVSFTPEIVATAVYTDGDKKRDLAIVKNATHSTALYMFKSTGTSNWKYNNFPGTWLPFSRMEVRNDKLNNAYDYFVKVPASRWFYKMMMSVGLDLHNTITEIYTRAGEYEHFQASACFHSQENDTESFWAKNPKIYEFVMTHVMTHDATFRECIRLSHVQPIVCRSSPVLSSTLDVTEWINKDFHMP